MGSPVASAILRSPSTCLAARFIASPSAAEGPSSSNADRDVGSRTRIRLRAASMTVTDPSDSTSHRIIAGALTSTRNAMGSGLSASFRVIR